MLLVTTQRTTCREFHGFAVHLQYKPPMEDMFETFEHHVVFESQRDCEKFRQKVQDRMRSNASNPLVALNFAHWVWGVSVCSPLSVMHQPSTAKRVFRKTTIRDVLGTD